MRPLSSHWADLAAFKIIQEKGDKDSYTLASGITPSGKVHFGNFREVITVDLVARALKKLGKEVRFIYSWDNFDTFRKVPKNVPNPQEFEDFLRRPIARIPDPWQKAESYSQGRIEIFEEELKKVGIAPEYIYQEKQYASGTYASQIRKALENKHKLRDLLNGFRTEDLDPSWLPTVIYCSKCEKDEMKVQRYDGEWDYFYECKNCGHKETVKINETKNLKLIWRVDWPMRWAYEKVDFEPGGKDHSSQGGSFDTGKEIIKEIWDEKAPSYLQYDFVKIKGGTGKMSSSSGELYTISDLLNVYEPQILRWIFTNQRPNHDFAIALDEDVIKTYEEFDKSERLALTKNPQDMNKKEIQNHRVFELSLVGEEIPQKYCERPSFRVLCNRLQICGGDISRTYDKYYKEFDFALFEQRAKCAWYWISNHAPKEFCYSLRTEVLDFSSFAKEQQDAIKGLVTLVREQDINELSPKDLNNHIWDYCIHKTSCDSKKAFQVIYQGLISRDQGPRLPGFLKEIGKDKILELLS